MACNSRKKKSGSLNRKCKKARMEEEAELREPMNIFFRKPTVNEEPQVGTSNDTSDIDFGDVLSIMGNKNENENTRGIMNEVVSDIPNENNDESEGDIDSEIPNENNDESEGDIDSEIPNENNDESEGDIDSEIPNENNDESEGDIDSEIPNENNDESEGDIDSEIPGENEDESEGDIDSEVPDESESESDINSKINDEVHETFIASEVVGKILSHDDKLSLLNRVPCQPTIAVLSKWKKKIGAHLRCCSEKLFQRQDGSKRSWLTYCLENNVLYCIPCLLFSDASLRGENQRRNQGNAFVHAEFSNWKEQFDAVKLHEASQAHIDSKLAHVMFLQRKSIDAVLKTQSDKHEQGRQRLVEANRKIMMRIVDTVLLLGKQELAFRGHRESFADDSSVNVGNFLEVLKYLSKYDEVIAAHLEKVVNDQRALEEKKTGTKKGDSSHRFGRGSRLTFLSGDIQNKLIKIISNEIVSEIVTLVKNSMAWALIADTTPDVTKHEQLSVCVRIVSNEGAVSEHLLFCTRAHATTADELFNIITTELDRLAVPFTNLVAQTYDCASNMAGKYNGLQAKLKEVAGERVIFVHCYAHTLNLVLSDAACASLEIPKLFDKLQSLYVMVSKSQPIHEIFEQIQQEADLTVRSLKRINTVRWSARELCLDMFLERYNTVIHTLDRVSTGKQFDTEKRSLADGLRNLFSTKQFIASAYLFREIFAITGPLSRTLQSINIDFGKALNMLENAMKQLEELRNCPQKI